MTRKKSVSKNLPEVTRNLADPVISWIVTHPDGHIYSLPKIDNLLNQFGLTQAELEARGWIFEART
ncbi:MAG: hypothetical protein ACK4KU_14300 [Acinetobacter sp.]|uniref:hypothetical protein n=1 Tax=Acinetobacter sp. TaxID=472 RepID=UPI00391D9468